MKPTLLVVLGALLVPAVASAQPARRAGYVPAYQQGYAPPPPGYAQPPPPLAPGGFHDRTGRMNLGFSFGLGKLKVDDSNVACVGCDGDPIAFGGEAHIGWMMSPRLALQLEINAFGQTVTDGDFYTETLMQTTEMIAAQYWVTPQLWIKGGIGAAQLALTYDDGFSSGQTEPRQGGAIMGAVGYEILSARNFAIDLQLRATGAAFEDALEAEDGTIQNASVGTTSLNVGLNWF